VINENSLRLDPPTRRAPTRGLESPIVTTPCPRPESAEEPAAPATAGRRPGEAARRRSPLAIGGRWGASPRWGLGHLRGGKLGAAMAGAFTGWGVGRGQTGRRRRRRRRGGGIEDEAVGFLIIFLCPGRGGLITAMATVCGLETSVFPPRARPQGRVPADGASSVGSGARWRDQGRRIPKLLEWLAGCRGQWGSTERDLLASWAHRANDRSVGLVYEPYRVAWQQ